MPIDHNGDGWAQTITITEPIFHSRIPLVQIIDHVSDGLPFDRNKPLTLREIAQ
jgi:hypothetical protein